MEAPSADFMLTSTERVFLNVECWCLPNFLSSPERSKAIIVRWVGLSLHHPGSPIGFTVVAPFYSTPLAGKRAGILRWSIQELCGHRQQTILFISTWLGSQLLSFPVPRFLCIMILYRWRVWVNHGAPPHEWEMGWYMAYTFIFLPTPCETRDNPAKKAFFWAIVFTGVLYMYRP